MKLRRVAYILFCLLVIGGMSSCGNDNAEKKPEAKKVVNKKPGAKKTSQKNLLDYKNQLKLTPDQVKRIKTVQTDFNNKRKKLPRVNGQIDKAGLKKLVDEKEAAIKKILTPEQQKKKQKLLAGKSSKAKKSPMSVESLKKSLNLSDAQAQQLRQLNKTYETKKKSLPKQNGKADSAKLKELYQLKKNEIKKILDTQQFKKYEQIVQRNSNKKNTK